MKQKGLLTTLILIFFSIYIVMGQDKFIEPCPDAGGYYSWLGGPRGNHLGHDYNAPPGTRVKAIADGTVYKVFDISQSHCYDPNTKREVKQTFVWIKHRLSNGQYFYALYGHIKPLGKIRDNANVKIGEEIGEIVQCYVYNEKKVLVPAHHLHFGIWNSESPPPLNAVGYGPVRSFTNPKKFLQENKPYVSLKTEDLSLKIIGKWIPEIDKKVEGKHTSTLEFNEDGTMILTMTYSGKWKIKGEEKIELSIDPQFFPGSPREITYQIKGDILSDIYGGVLTKEKDAQLIKSTLHGKIWNKYGTDSKGIKIELELKENGTFLNTMYFYQRYKTDGKVIKVYTLKGEESPWIYELKGEKIEVKLKDAPQTSFIPYVKAPGRGI
jgi:hypothetical protein